MDGAGPAEYREVLESIRVWPPDVRRGLIRDLRRTLDVERAVRPTRGSSAGEVVRTLKPGRPAPTDEECERILEEELMTK